MEGSGGVSGVSALGPAMARIATEPSFLEQHKRLNKYKPRANNRSWAGLPCVKILTSMYRNIDSQLNLLTVSTDPFSIVS